MALTPEKKVKNKVVAILKEVGAYYFYPVTGGFGASGVPDIVCCYYGRFLAIECKAGNNTLSALQRQNIESIKRNQGIALVINEDNVDEVREILRWIQAAFAAPQTDSQRAGEEPADGSGADARIV